MFKIDFTFEIRLYEEWDERFRDKGSEKFKKLATLMKNEVCMLFMVTIHALVIKCI